MYRTEEYQTEIQKIADYFWYFNRNPFIWPLVILVLAATPDPVLFTEIELTAMFYISTGIAILVHLYQTLWGKAPTLLLHVIAAFGVKWSVLCSICFSVYFAFLSYLLWWLVVALVPAHQQRVSDTCRRFCSYTGGGEIWEMREILTIPITPVAILLSYIPFMTLSFIAFLVSAVGLSLFLVVNWQSHQLEMTLDEWTYQLFGEIQLKRYSIPYK